MFLDEFFFVLLGWTRVDFCNEIESGSTGNGQLGQTYFGQTDFDLCVCVFVCVFVFHGFRVGDSEFWFGHVRCSRDRPPFLGPPYAGPPKISLFYFSPTATFVDQDVPCRPRDNRNDC